MAAEVTGFPSSNRSSEEGGGPRSPAAAAQDASHRHHPCQQQHQQYRRSSLGCNGTGGVTCRGLPPWADLLMGSAGHTCCFSGGVGGRTTSQFGSSASMPASAAPSVPSPRTLSTESSLPSVELHPLDHPAAAPPLSPSSSSPPQGGGPPAVGSAAWRMLQELYAELREVLSGPRFAEAIRSAVQHCFRMLARHLCDGFPPAPPSTPPSSEAATPYSQQQQQQAATAAAHAAAASMRRSASHMFGAVPSGREGSGGLGLHEESKRPLARLLRTVQVSGDLLMLQGNVRVLTKGISELGNVMAVAAEAFAGASGRARGSIHSAALMI